MSNSPGDGAEIQRNVKVIVAVSVICMLVVTAITALRLYTRHCLLHKLGIDDILAVFSGVGPNS